MYRFLLTTILGVTLAGPMWAQEADEQVGDTEVVEDTNPAIEEPTDEAEAEVETEEFDEAGLDEQGFSDEDDDFRPSEVIPTDQSIEFPTDI